MGVYKLVVTLNKLGINSIGIVKNIKLDDKIKRRIADLGIIKDTKIKPVFSGACGGIRAYEIRNILLAVRDEDASKIHVEIC